MLYPLTLPDETRECLLDVVWLQMDLLDYAATKMPLPSTGQAPAKRKQELVKTCACYLDEYGTRCRGYGDEIARSFFQSYRTNAGNKNRAENKECETANKGDGGRFNALETFAYEYRETPGDTKDQWRARLRQEVAALADGQSPTLTILNFYDESEPGKESSQQSAGKRQAGQFFLTFYENWLGKSDSKIPNAFITSTEIRLFGRQQLLAFFHQRNDALHICAVCDETRFYTRYKVAQGKEAHRVSHAILDHFLPKSKYPHLCCHPYNIVPVCYSCNSPVKGTRDPLLDQTKRQRRILHRDAFPYGRFNLSEYAYLKVDHASSPSLISSYAIVPRASYPQSYVQESIDLLQDTFKLLERWLDGNVQAERVMDTLFRRMRHFFEDGKVYSHGINVEDEIDKMLRHLLYYIDHDDKQKDPLTFAMSWVLASFIKEHEKNSAAWKGLVREIDFLFGQSLKKNEERNQYVQQLLDNLG